jgi:hypothetical protein
MTQHAPSPNAFLMRISGKVRDGYKWLCLWKSRIWWRVQKIFFRAAVCHRIISTLLKVCNKCTSEESYQCFLRKSRFWLRRSGQVLVSVGLRSSQEMLLCCWFGHTAGQGNPEKQNWQNAQIHTHTHTHTQACTQTYPHELYVCEKIFMMEIGSQISKKSHDLLCAVRNAVMSFILSWRPENQAWWCPSTGEDRCPSARGERMCLSCAFWFLSAPQGVGSHWECGSSLFSLLISKGNL